MRAVHINKSIDPPIDEQVNIVLDEPDHAMSQEEFKIDALLLYEILKKDIPGPTYGYLAGLISYGVGSSDATIARKLAEWHIHPNELDKRKLTWEAASQRLMPIEPVSSLSPEDQAEYDAILAQLKAKEEQNHDENR